MDDDRRRQQPADEPDGERDRGPDHRDRPVPQQPVDPGDQEEPEPSAPAAADLVDADGDEATRATSTRVVPAADALVAEKPGGRQAVVS